MKDSPRIASSKTDELYSLIGGEEVKSAELGQARHVLCNTTTFSIKGMEFDYKKWKEDSNYIYLL